MSTTVRFARNGRIVPLEEPTGADYLWPDRAARTSTDGCGRMFTWPDGEVLFCTRHSYDGLCQAPWGLGWRTFTVADRLGFRGMYDRALEAMDQVVSETFEPPSPLWSYLTDNMSAPRQLTKADLEQFQPEPGTIVIIPPTTTIKVTEITEISGVGPW